MSKISILFNKCIINKFNIIFFQYINLKTFYLTKNNIKMQFYEKKFFLSDFTLKSISFQYKHDCLLNTAV